jgi:hypothetical protein
MFISFLFHLSVREWNMLKFKNSPMGNIATVFGLKLRGVAACMYIWCEC